MKYRDTYSNEIKTVADARAQYEDDKWMHAVEMSFEEWLRGMVADGYYEEIKEEQRNNFDTEYALEQAIRAAYNIAKETGNESEIEKAKADMRSLNDEIGAKGDAYAFVYRLYQEMKEAGNEHIDLHDAIRDEAKMIKTLRSLGVESFTFSSGWSSAVESAWIFQQNGCRLEGLIELNGTAKDWITGEREKVHGYLFSIQ